MTEMPSTRAWYAHSYSSYYSFFRKKMLLFIRKSIRFSLFGQRVNLPPVMERCPACPRHKSQCLQKFNHLHTWYEKITRTEYDPIQQLATHPVTWKQQRRRRCNPTLATLQHIQQTALRTRAIQKSTHLSYNNSSLTASASPKPRIGRLSKMKS